MAEQNGNATKIARAYVDAIANKDVDTIIAISAEDVVCTSPIGKLTGAQAFRGFHDGFVRMTKTVTILAVYGDNDQAVVVYTAETHPVPHTVIAELLKVKDGKIASTEAIYDATPFAAYMATIKPH